MANSFRFTKVSDTNILLLYPIFQSYLFIYIECWKGEPSERPDILQVVSELNNIDHIDLENNSVSINFNSEESKITEKIENRDSDMPGCEDCDITSDRYKM